MINVLGVDHFEVQLPHQNNNNRKIESYLTKVKSLYQERKIQLIAEESSEDALLYWKIEATHVGKMVIELGIPYLLCDPGFVERNNLGIKQRETIAHELSFSVPITHGSPEEKRINEIVKDSDQKREKYWLDQIRLNSKADEEILLICGFEHIDSFIKLAKKEGFPVQKVD